MDNIISVDDKEFLEFVFRESLKKSYVSATQSLQNELKEQIEKQNVPEAEIDLQHLFMSGLYLRQMNTKAGTLIVSKMHKTEHFIIFLEGIMSILTDDGVEEIQAPCIHRTIPGTKRVIYFHTDSSCLTIHPTNETDLNQIEKQIIVPEEQEQLFIDGLNAKCLGGLI